MGTDVRVDFDPGVDSNPIVAIFQNPGNAERQAKPPHPAAGITGKHLSVLLSMLNEHISNGNGWLCRDHLKYDHVTPKSGIMIANARRDSVSEECINIGFDCNHVRFVAEKIKDKRLVLCFGDQAELFYKQIVQSTCSIKPTCDQKVIYCCHLSFKSLNNLIKFDANGFRISVGDKDATKRRLSVISMFVGRCLRGRRSGRFKDFEKRRSKIMEAKTCHS